MQHLNKDTFPWACSVKFAKVTYKTIDKRNIYIMIIYLSQPFPYTTEPENLKQI